MKNKAVWVALGVLAIATALMMFIVLPNIDNKDGGTPATSQTSATATADAAADAAATSGKGERVPATQETPAEETASAAGSAAGAAADAAVALVTPGFDILRVEPDGSTVIAGRAQPDSKLEIVNGDKVLATADVGPTGDFAAVFDTPLPAGDYQLTLRSTGKDGKVTTSEEVATVSVPTDKAGELLAMVSKPGEASRLITTPKAETAAAEANPAAVTSAGEAASGATDAAPADADQTPASGDAATQTAALAADGTAAAGSSDAVAGNAASAQLRVSAVEIEGDKVFVAGAAKAGALVRIYADDKLLGEGKADEAGRFVIDGTMPLSVGSHVIRADVINADGSKVDLRASVPFERPMGEQVAVVADQQAVSGQPDTALSLVGGGRFDRLRSDATKALNLLKTLFADGKVPPVDQLAAARSATEIALDSLAKFRLTEEVDPRMAETVADASKGAAAALALLKELPKDAASVGAAIGKIETAVGAALMPRSDDAVPQTSSDAVPATGIDNAASAPAGDVPAEDAAVLPGTTAQTAESAASTGSEPETIEQAPLKQSKSSVIIRRGDTLWQISRRVYGAGVRYTTIYLANEDQISNPDRIIPGQVFGVPDEARPDAEELHRKRVKGG